MITMKELRYYLTQGDTWYPVKGDHNFNVGDIVRTPDGLTKIVSIATDGSSFIGEIITPIHDDVEKGEQYEYRHYETTVLAKTKDKRQARSRDKIDTKAQQKEKDDELLMIDDVVGRHKKNEITINPIIEILDNILSKNQIKDLTKINGNIVVEGKMSDAMIKGISLAVKRKVMVLGKKAQGEKDLEKKLDLISRQISATAAIALLAVSVSGDGVLSKAGMVSGLFSG